MIETLGPSLIARGYNIIPIQPSRKNPSIRGWQNARLSATDCAQWRGHGVGVLTGVGAHPLCAFDVDTVDEGLADWFEAWLAERYGLCAVRVGAAPKRLVLFRAAEPGWAKVSSVWFEDIFDQRHRLEVLGAGQQFVAFGVHPSGVQYEWTDMWDGIAGLDAADLSVLTIEQVREAVEAFEKEALRRGMMHVAAPGHGANTAPTTREEAWSAGAVAVTDGGNTRSAAARDPLENYSPPLGLSIAEAQDLLRFAGDPADYDAWLRLGMALHHEGGGADEWFEAWNGWSSRAENYVSLEDLIFRWNGFGRTVAAGGRPMTLKYLVKAASEARTEALAVAGSADYPRTEAGNAARLVDKWGRDLLFCAELGAWYRWSGKHWRAVSLTEVRHLAKGVVEDMRGGVVLCTTDREKAELMKWCAASQRWTMYDHMVSIASLSAGLWVRASELDGDKRYLGVQNGVVDLFTGELLPPDRSRRVTRLCSVEYRADAVCPLFEQQIRDVFGDDAELCAFWWRFMGYTLQGNPVEDVLCLNIGNGNNGKSTTMQPVVAVLGDYATTAPAALFLADGMGGAGSGGGARPDLLALAGRRLVLVNEPDEGGELREGLVKAMTGGESLPARALYSSVVVQIAPTWVVVMSTNHKPLVRGEDKGIWRRLLPVPWERDFDHGGVKDAHREEKLMAELEGILAALVRGGLAYRRAGLAVPSRVDGSRREYRGEMDLLADWLNERCVVGADGGGDSVSLDALWLDWEPWARVRGELRFVSSRKALAKRLRNRGLLVEKTMKGSQVAGVKLRNLAITSG